MSDAATNTPSWRDDPAWPDVDVVMPIRNEAAHLEAAVAGVRDQDYHGRVRIIIGLGPSDDGTAETARALAGADGDLLIVDNPTGHTPTALNLAIGAGSAPVVVRVDGHSRLSPGYIRRAVQTMRRTGAVNVGGMQVPVGTTPFERAVAAATTSWLGTGGAAYRTGGGEHAVDTVYLGVFDRAALEAVGSFDERLIRNQDYELNIRLRRAGGVVMFDPELAVAYTPRGSWRGIIRQYFEYGRWKAVVMRMHPDSTRLRQVVPPVAMCMLAVSVALSRRHRLFRVPLALYAGASSVEAVRSARRHRAYPVLVAAMFPSIHLSWTVGLLSPNRSRPDVGRRRRDAGVTITGDERD